MLIGGSDNIDRYLKLEPSSYSGDYQYIPIFEVRRWRVCMSLLGPQLSKSGEVSRGVSKVRDEVRRVLLHVRVRDKSRKSTLYTLRY